MRTLTLTALVLAALAAGCGADDESKPTIPADTATGLADQLNSIEDRFEFPGGQACGDITGGSDPNTAPVENLIASVPDEEMRSALEDSFNRLFELVEQECAELQESETTPETTTTETTTETEPPTTDTTETTDTTTDTTETVPPTESIPTETLPPEGDGEGGGFGPEGDE